MLVSRALPLDLHDSSAGGTGWSAVQTNQSLLISILLYMHKGLKGRFSSQLFCPPESGVMKCIFLPYRS